MNAKMERYAAIAKFMDRLIRLKDGKINEVANQPNPVPMAEVVW